MEKKNKKFNYWQIATLVLGVVAVVGVASASVINAYGNMNIQNATINMAAPSETVSAVGEGEVLGGTTRDTWVTGGSVTAVATAVSTTLSNAQVCGASVISVTPSGAAINVTLPSTTTLAADCLAFDGATKSFLYENAATAATSTTLVAGTGITLLGNAVASTTASQAAVISQNQWARITLTRVRASEYTAEVVSLGDAD